MPTTAQHRARGGPFAALLILLGLLLGSANAAAAGADIRAPASRLGSSRPGQAAALPPSGTRNPLEDETPGAGAGPSLPASGPAIVSERLPARPSGEAEARTRDFAPPPPRASYRARAPPAS